MICQWCQITWNRYQCDFHFLEAMYIILTTWLIDFWYLVTSCARWMCTLIMNCTQTLMRILFLHQLSVHWNFHPCGFTTWRAEESWRKPICTIISTLSSFNIYHVAVCMGIMRADAIIWYYVLCLLPSLTKPHIHCQSYVRHLHVTCSAIALCRLITTTTVLWNYSMAAYMGHFESGLCLMGFYHSEHTSVFMGGAYLCMIHEDFYQTSVFPCPMYCYIILSYGCRCAY